MKVYLPVMMCLNDLCYVYLVYAFRCFFAKAQCKDSSIHILHDGDCLPSDFTTPSPGVDGEQAVLDFFCNNLSHRDCPSDSSKLVCGSDNRTYDN